jgi:hypothetical protein
MLLLDSLENDPNSRLLVNMLGAVLFVIVFVLFTDTLNSKTRSYMGQYIYQLGFLIFVYLICISNKYLGILAFLLFILQFKMACKESFSMFNPPDGEQSPAISTSYTTTPIPSTPTTTKSPLFAVLDVSPSLNLEDEKLEVLTKEYEAAAKADIAPITAEDDLFTMDPVKKSEILRAVRAQLDFDPYKSDLTRETILDIYRKYFGEDEALKFRREYETAQSYQP